MAHNPLGFWRRFSIPARVLLILGLLTVTVETAHVTRRAGHAQTDVSVFYRMAVDLMGGVPAEFYREPDALTNWPRCYPPSAGIITAWMPWLDMQGAVLVWSLLKLGLLALAAYGLWQVFGRLDRHRRLYQRTWLWATALLLVLASGSVQVGQYSDLFVACWLLCLWATSAGCPAAASLLVTIPACIKLYPALLWLDPLIMRRWRQVLMIGAWLVVLCLVVPYLLYGSHTLQMWEGFIKYILLLPGNRISMFAESQTLNNQSLDAVAFRYLTYTPACHDVYPWFPHLSLPRETVFAITKVFRLAALLITVLAAFRLSVWGRARYPQWANLLGMSLWTATIFLLMPETKSRYAVYMAPALLPLLVIAAGNYGRRWRYAVYCLFLVLIAAFTLQFVTESWRILGFSFLASLVVWWTLVRLAWSPLGTRSTKPLPAASNQE